VQRNASQTMKRTIPQYTFYKKKYGDELLIDVVELNHIKSFLAKSSVHTLTYYDLTFITEGEGTFSIDSKSYKASPGDVFFSKPGEIRNWDIHNILNGQALIFEDEFLSSFFKDPLFVQHLSFFNLEKTSSKIHLAENLYTHILELLQNIKEEIDHFKQNDEHVLRALLYEILMLLNRIYLQNTEQEEESKKRHSLYLNRFIHLVDSTLKEHRSVQYYAEKLCITPNYLNELTNAAMQISSKQYIQNKVMEEAKKLLLYTDLSISEIAFELHYDTVSYFIRSFKKHQKKTPLAYRKEQKP